MQFKSTWLYISIINFFETSFYTNKVNNTSFLTNYILSYIL